MSMGTIESNDARSLNVKTKTERHQSSTQSAHALALTGMTGSKIKDNEDISKHFSCFQYCLYTQYLGIYLADEVA